MKKHLFRTWIALLAALILSLSCVLGETADSAEPVLLVTVNGEEIYDNNADLVELVNYYSSYYASYGYDTTDASLQTMFKATGLQWAVECALYRQKAAELGITSLNEEEIAALEAAAREEWEEAVNYYQAQVAPTTDESTEEEIAAARVYALAYIESNFGYTEESYVQEYVDGNIQTQLRQKVIDAEIGEITVSEQEIIDYFNEHVETDKASYEGNIFMYEYYTQYMGETSYYVPEGYRGITHILLEVDDDLLKTYTDLSARFEEQKEDNAEETADDTEETADDTEETEEDTEEDTAENTAEEVSGFEAAEIPVGVLTGQAGDEEDTYVEEEEEDDGDVTEEDETEEETGEETEEETGEEGGSETGEDAAEEIQEKVTEEMVEAAKQAILDSVQPTVDEIMNKFNAGTPFADLIDEYGTDPGMQSEPNKSQGYMVHADSILWDPAFITGAMTLEKIGDVSEPVLGSYGIHILFYLRDVPAGAVDMTEEIRENLSSELLSTKESEATAAMMERWTAESDIQYTEAGLALKAEAEAAAAADDSEDEGEEGDFEIEVEEGDGELEVEWADDGDEESAE